MKLLQGGDKLTLSLSGTPAATTDDSVTVTHFSLDSWGQIEQKTTPLSPKANNRGQNNNPFNPFKNETSVDEVVLVENNEENKPREEKLNTNPFIDANPFLGLLNPFNDSNFAEIKVEDKPPKVEEVTVCDGPKSVSPPPVVTLKVVLPIFILI